MDRAYEDDQTRLLAINQGFIPVVPPKKNRRTPWKYDLLLYIRRNEVERFFLRIKRFRKVFTRYDKLDIIYFSVILFALIFDYIFMSTRSSLSPKGICEKMSKISPVKRMPPNFSESLKTGAS